MQNSAQDMAVRTLSNVIADVAEKTGFAITVLMGGPNPSNGGEITTASLHNSGTNEVPSFEQWINAMFCRS